jgi:transposase
VKITKSNLGGKKYRNELLSKHPLKKMWIIQMVCLLNILETIEIEKKQLKEIIVYNGYKQFPKEVTKLISIKGFSPFTSVALMTDICTIERFTNSKKFCSYLRTAPKVTASNNTVHLGKINKRGRTLTCSLLTQSVIHIGNANQHFINFKERLQKGKKACTVRIAIIRKILTSAYHMLKNNEVFRGVDKKSYKRKLMELNRTIKKYDKIEGKVVA